MFKYFPSNWVLGYWYKGGKWPSNKSPKHILIDFYSQPFLCWYQSGVQTTGKGLIYRDSLYCGNVKLMTNSTSQTSVKRALKWGITWFFPFFPFLRMIWIRKTGFMGTIGILRSNPIRGYPYHSCSCPEWATKDPNVRTGKPVVKPVRTGKRFLRPRFWVPGVKTVPTVPYMWS